MNRNNGQIDSKPSWSEFVSETMVRDVYRELIEKYKYEEKDPSRLEKRLRCFNKKLWKRNKAGRRVGS